MTQENTQHCAASVYVYVYGMDEAQIKERCAAWLEGCGEIHMTLSASLGECRMRLEAYDQSEEEALDRLEGAVDTIEELLGEAVYAVKRTADGSMEEAAVNALAQNGLTVATAESCTGGMIASRLVNVPGCSDVLGEAHVTYANEAKIKFCGVRAETLAQYGAVSEQTVREMSEGLRMRSGADIVAASSGIAGPGGGTPEKPVGLVYLACASANGTEIRRMQFTGNRGQVRSQAALCALDMVRRAAAQYREEQ